MEDELLLKIAMAGACVGIFLLYLIMQFTDYATVNVEQIKNMPDSEEFYAYGKAYDVRETDKALSFTIGEVKIIKEQGIYFKDSNKTVGVKEGDYIRIKASKYNGRLMAKSIQKVNTFPQDNPNP